jgi:transposase-like protein
MPGRRDIAVKQSIPPQLRYSFQDFMREFPTDDACLMYIFEQRWPGGIVYCDSEKCKKETKHHRVTGRTAFACDRCGWHIYPLAGTIFEKSTTSLQKWFHAMYQMGSTRCGISAKQIQRETSVTYKTAWRMFKQIRSLMSEGDLQLEGPSVEMDETYFGGRIRGQGKGPKLQNKTRIAGIVERKGKIIAKTATEKGNNQLLKLAGEHILPDSAVYTDEYAAYDKLADLQKDGKPLGYTHRRIHHASKVYVVGDVHTNTVGGFWSLLKRGIGGVYHSVSQKYLQTYLDEYTFRYNRRDQGNLIFKSILEQVSKRAVD